MSETTSCNANSNPEYFEVTDSVTPRERLSSELQNGTWGGMTDAMQKYAGACFHCGRDLHAGPAVIFGANRWVLCETCAREGLDRAIGPLPYPRYLDNVKPEKCGNCQRLFWLVNVPPTRGGYQDWRKVPYFCCGYCRRNHVSVQSRTRPDPVECPICRETFEPQRKSATYCGNTCRQRAKRLRDAFNTPLKEATL